MICNQCGAQLPEGTTVCPNCGAALNAQPQYQQPFQAQPVAAQPNILVFGILSLVFSGIVGLILGIVGRKKGKAFVAQGGQLTGGSKVGFILSLVGIIVSIVAIVIIVIYAIAAGSFIASLR